MVILTAKRVRMFKAKPWEVAVALEKETGFKVIAARDEMQLTYPRHIKSKENRERFVHIPVSLTRKLHAPEAGRAVTTAHGHLELDRIDALFIPGFVEVEIDGL